MREIFSLLAFLIPWNFASSETFTGSSEWRNDTTLYDCIDASPHQGSGNLFTVPPNLNFESHSYIFPVIQSLKPLPCLGQPGHKRILSLTPSEVIFSPLGHIKVIGANVGGFGVIYNPEEYCIKRNFSLVEIHYCVSQCAQPNEPISVESDKRKEVCVPKCCLPGFIIDYNTNERCTRAAVDWTPTFYHASSVNTQRCIAEVERKQQPFYRLIHPNEGWCSIKILYPRIRLSADSLDRSSWRMLENGSIVRKDEGRGPLDWKATWLISSNLSCIDGIKNFTNLKADFYKDYSGARGHELLKECLDEDFSNWEEADQSEEYLSEPSNVKSYVYIFALFASLIPLGLTIVAYWITWTFQNIHGWTVFSHIVSLFLWYIFLGSAQILSLGEDGAQSSTVGCEFVGVMVHFFFLSTFFWLTMVNFDLWSKFRDLQPTSGNRAEMLPFIGYAIFAWGGPLLIVLTGVILDSMFGRHGHESDCDIILPEYGVTRCHLNKRAEGVYLYFIIGLLILLNVGFFISLILILYRYKQSSAVASRRKSTGRADITSSELFLKLFVVMGCSFALEFISWVVESNTDKTENISWVWIAFDFINILVRAIFIFIIFAWKKQTLIEFKKRCPTACWNICFGRFMPDSEESVAGPSASGMQMTKISTPSVQG